MVMKNTAVKMNDREEAQRTVKKGIAPVLKSAPGKKTNKKVK